MQEADRQEREIALCTHCAAPLKGDEHFCEQCGCPASSAAMSMPYESVLARGFAWRTGSTRPRKAIIVIGMWIMFAPMLGVSLSLFVVLLVGFVSVAAQPDPLRGMVATLVGLVFTGGLATVAMALLYKTTRNYFELRGINESEDADEFDEEKEVDDYEE